MILHILSAIFLGILLSGIWFGMNSILCIWASKIILEMISRFSMIVSAMIPTAIILKNSKLNLLDFASIGDWKSWLILAVTVLVVSVISARNKITTLPEGKELLWYALDGVFMEIPQRMMMQSFICLLMKAWNENIYLSVLITAIIWCVSICIQCVIMKRRFDTGVMRELFASFVFSMGVGVILLRTEFIGFTMLAHFAERILSTMFRKISKDMERK